MLVQHIMETADRCTAKKLKLPKQISLLQNMPAVVTFEQNGVLTLHIELWRHGLITIANARRINTLHNILNHFWQLNFLLLNYLIISDYVYRCLRRNQSNAINLLTTQSPALNLNYILHAHASAGNVDAYSNNLTLMPRDAQYLRNLKGVSAVYVIYDCAVLDF